MANALQLDLFEDAISFRDEDLALLDMKQENLRVRQNNLQKGIFKRYGEHDKRLSKHATQLEKLEAEVYFLRCTLKEKLGIEMSFDGTLKI